MKLIKYFMRGVEDLVREFTRVKRIVEPRRPSPPATGRTREVLRYLASTHSLYSVALFDPNGAFIESSRDTERIKELFEQVLPLYEELDAKYLFLRRKDGWLTLFRRRGFYLLMESAYKPDVVDLWVIGREFERYMWGSTWED